MNKKLLLVPWILVVLALCSCGVVPHVVPQTFTVGPVETVASVAEVATMTDGGQWPDASIGIIPTGGGTYTFAAPSGDGLGSPSLSFGGTLAAPITSNHHSAPIKDASGNNIADTTSGAAKYTYAGSGSVYQEAGGSWILFYHAENTRPGDTIGNFYSTIGTAISSDQGLSWLDLGEIITPYLSYATWQTTCVDNITFCEVEIGTASYVIATDAGVDYFYVYYHDHQPPYPYQDNNTISYLAVARAKVTDVVTAALNHQVVPWTKYDSGSWSQPGLGGHGSALESGNPDCGAGISVSWNTYLNEYVLVADRGYYVSPQLPSGIYLAFSPDGLTWTPRTLAVADGPGSIFRAYPTQVGTGTDPSVTDKQFYIYAGNYDGALYTPQGLVRYLITLN